MDGRRSEDEWKGVDIYVKRKRGSAACHNDEMNSRRSRNEWRGGTKTSSEERAGCGEAFVQRCRDEQ
ncbi:hypothetical protein E2C01_071075 [Portunus trituberculatus]|uniref:Uncharacterized protein n=1 Tax=Portunus trituberculatus TaxID=210409 RepID=A0A5B7HZ22_PORTR|nr:hypothetical protein [Portunus trituberculatus]